MSLICALDLRGRWRAIDFEVPKLSFYKSDLIFTFGVRCSLFGLSFFFLLSSVYVFLTIGICIYLCFSEKVLFQFLTVGFISHTTGILNKTGFIWKKLVLKKINLTIFSRFKKLQNLKQIFGKHLPLKKLALTSS